MVTIRDVAKESGFSAATVSIVLNNAPLARYIPAATKGRIQKAATTQSGRALTAASRIRPSCIRPRRTRGGFCRLG